MIIIMHFFYSWCILCWLALHSGAGCLQLECGLQWCGGLSHSHGAPLVLPALSAAHCSQEDQTSLSVSAVATLFPP